MVQSKLPDVGTTIFSVMSALAAKSGAINLSQGFPDFEPPAALRRAVTRRINSGHNQYPPMHGVPALREAIARRFESRYHTTLDPETEITVTSGATEAIFCAITALCHAGDDVLIFDPAYDCYAPAVRLTGARPVHLPLVGDDFRIDFERLAQALTDKTRLVILNSPHNPTATTISGADLDQLADTLAPHNCWLLSDEVYDAMVFDDRRHTSVVAHPQLRDRSVAVFSFGKTYHATGWKIGYAVAGPALTKELRRIHQYNTFATAGPLQWALADFMTDEPEFEASLASFYADKRDHFEQAMRNSQFRLPTSAGTYFQLAEYSALSDQPDTEFARWLTTEIGVAAIPISVFCQQPLQGNWVRFCFAKEAATLTEAARRLSAI
ncbi:MAG: methionine aminotransferase [Gammaproteobacteria bacterium]